MAMTSAETLICHQCKRESRDSETQYWYWKMLNLGNIMHYLQN